MKIQVNDRILEFDLPENDRVMRTDITPYWEEFCTKNGKVGSDFKRRYYFQQLIAKSLKGTYKSYLDPMAGLGIVASMFDGEGINLYLSDIDEVCYRSLKHNFEGEVVLQGDYNHAWYTAWYDVSFLDFNNFTAKRFMENEFKLNDFLLKVMKCTNDVIIINDSTPFYLRYGAKSYKVVGDAVGQEIHTYEEYLVAMSNLFLEYGWSITDSYKFGSMAYQKLQRVPVREVTIHSVPKDYKFNLKIL